MSTSKRKKQDQIQATMPETLTSFRETFQLTCFCVFEVPLVRLSAK